LALAGAIAGCGSRSTPDGAANQPADSETDPQVEHPQGDPSVPAELGGPGFKGGDGWVTANPGPLGDARAKRGGTMMTNIPTWPDNLRIYGIGTTSFNSILGNLCYESLCGMHPETLEPIPGLASHWKISADKMTFTFRIDPRAHWSDGKPVVAEDVAATYKLIMDESLLEPNYRTMLLPMEAPKVLSKYMLEVQCKQKHWRNFLTISGLMILPAHEIGKLTGEQYRTQYNFKFTAVNGPYNVLTEDVRKDESITLTRRSNYWRDGDEMTRGLYNFDAIRFLSIDDDRLAFDMVLKGDIDYYEVNTAAWWIEDIVGKQGNSPLASVRNGWLVAQKVFTRVAHNIQGDAFNMRGAPLGDVRVRLAVAHLFDRKTLLAKFAYNEYEPLKSYFSGDGENPDNKLVEYDPDKALALLEEAGFTERGADGILMRKGERLSLKLTFGQPAFERYYTSFQESCRKAGVEIKLNLMDPMRAIKALEERNFQFSGAAFTGSLFPEPRPSWGSKAADEQGSNNVAGLKDPEVDKLLDQYDREFDTQKRNAILRQIDGLVFKQHPFMLQWYLPCQRILWWNKFGMPDTVFTKYADMADAYARWWYDPEKDAALKAARSSQKPLSPIPLRELRPWPTAAVNQGS
jgi:microcin C transport system substrate-binding protein